MESTSDAHITMRIGSEFNVHHERSQVANWMRIARFKATLRLASYPGSLIATHAAPPESLGTRLHCVLPSLQRCFKCPLQRFTSLPRAFCLLACTHTLKSQFASNPLSVCPEWFKYYLIITMQGGTGGALNKLIMVGPVPN